MKSVAFIPQETGNTGEAKSVTSDSCYKRSLGLLCGNEFGGAGV